MVLSWHVRVEVDGGSGKVEICFLILANASRLAFMRICSILTV